MKNILFFLFISALVFASFFPEAITGSEMVLTYEYGSIPELDQAFADYSNVDASIAGDVQTDYVAGDYGTITNVFGPVADSYTKTTEPGTTCYYLCNTIPGEDFSSGYCDMDCYVGDTEEGIYYYMWVVTLGGSEQLAYTEIILLATEMTNFIYSVYDPEDYDSGNLDEQSGEFGDNGIGGDDGTGNGVPDGNDELDGNGVGNMSNTTDGEADKETEVCAPAFVLGLLVLGFIYRN